MISKIIIEAGAVQEVYIRTSDILAARAALRGDALREALAPKPKGDPRPTAKQAARGLEKAFAPKEEHPIAREADENRRRRQKEFEAIVALRALHDPGAR